MLLLYAFEYIAMSYLHCVITLLKVIGFPLYGLAFFNLDLESSEFRVITGGTVFELLMKLGFE